MVDNWSKVIKIKKIIGPRTTSVDLKRFLYWYNWLIPTIKVQEYHMYDITTKKRRLVLRTRQLSMKGAWA